MLDKVSGPNDPQSPERQWLRARALADLKQYDQALALIAKSDGEPAKRLRADITWKAQRWSDAAAVLGDLLGSPPPSGEKLSETKAQWAVDRAVALAMAGDSASLDKLRADFAASLSGTPQNSAFQVLTRPDRVNDLLDAASLKAKVSEVDLFQSFLDSYRQPANNNAANSSAPQKH